MTALDRVVLVHGLWMTGLEFGVLRRRLADEHGFDVEVFTYPTTGGDAAAIVAALRRQLQPRAGERVHLVGHSLGGAFVYRALCDECGCGAGVSNAVLLGSPLAAAARHKWPRASRCCSHCSVLTSCGNSPRHRLVPGAGRSRSARSLAAVHSGMGRFLAHFAEDNDGTVGVGETRIPGLADHLVLPHSHLGMLFATDVAAQVARFLREGHFDHGV